MRGSISFDFGRNWEQFSEAKLDAGRLQAAVDSLQSLIGADNLKGRTFLDVGCGSGLFSLAAAKCGASRVVGFDVNPTAIEVCQRNLSRLGSEPLTSRSPEFRVADVLDEAFLTTMDRFDVVYAWGVLHHTGALWEAVRKTASLAHAQRGTLVLAIYNRHWTSPAWRWIKRRYNWSPRFVRSVLNRLFGAAIYIGVWVTTRQNPLRKERGMDFWFDVVDWLGGYPYEYASPAEVIAFVHSLGFDLERMVSPRAGTGCNEFVFRRRPDQVRA